MPKIKNKLYLSFLNGEFIQTLNINIIDKVLENINLKQKKHKEEARVLLLLLYYTGARPAEILELKGDHIRKEGRDLIIHILTLKKGVPRTLSISFKKPYINDVWKYTQRIFPTFYLFDHFRSKYERHTFSKPKYDKQTNNIIAEGIPKTYKETSAKLRNYFKIWFEGITENEIIPYFLRHNRFSIMSEKGASLEQIKLFKGSKTMDSVSPYIHISKKSAKEFSKYI